MGACKDCIKFKKSRLKINPGCMRIVVGDCMHDKRPVPIGVYEDEAFTCTVQVCKKVRIRTINYYTLIRKRG